MDCQLIAEGVHCQGLALPWLPLGSHCRWQVYTTHDRGQAFKWRVRP
nr:MAG TPA: hypothetical protein [Caudoviricetes sp.]